MKTRLALLLFTWFTVVAALAQPAPPRPAQVDSRQECAALGGAWLANRDTWQAACQVPWGREDCLRLGGAWTPMSAAPAGGVCVAQVSQRATARQCAESGGTWGPPGSAMPYCQAGTGRARPPAKPASDANKACGNQKECIYGCVYKGPVVPPGANVTGSCRATIEGSGCYSMVDGGKLAGEVCLK